MAWLKDFEARLRHDGLTVNTIACHLRDIRAVYNDAIDYGAASLADYPFWRFKIVHEATPKRSLSVEQLRTLKDYPCQLHQEKYRDLFMLIFYLCALTEVVNGRVEYKRAKTFALYSIKVEPEAQAIIDKYKGAGYLLFPLDNYANHIDFLRRMNKNLQEIGPAKPCRSGKKKRTGLFPGLSSYWVRHT